MTLTIHDELEQGSDEWLAQRCGLITASVIGKLITPTLKVADNDVSRGITTTLAAERITGHVEPVFVNADMQRGHDEEGPSRDLYAADTGHTVTEVGFMTENKWGFTIGYSPDALINDDGLFETKSRRAKKHITTILADAVPPENYAQLQCGLLVSGRDWIDYASYSNGLHFWTKRVYPEPKWSDAMIAAATTLERNITDMVTRYETATTHLPLAAYVPDLDDITF